MRVEVRTRQVCLYCLEPFESRMVPFVMPSKAHQNSHFWLHVRCVEAAFASSRSLVDAEDMAVDVAIPPDGIGWGEIPDDQLPDL